jgi:hypothetical protein
MPSAPNCTVKSNIGGMQFLCELGEGVDDAAPPGDHSEYPLQRTQPWN